MYTLRSLNNNGHLILIHFKDTPLKTVTCFIDEQNTRDKPCQESLVKRQDLKNPFFSRCDNAAGSPLKQLLPG